MTNSNSDLHCLGQRLRIAREAVNLSTREVSLLLSGSGKAVSHATVANYERGLSQPSAEIVELLAGIYKQSLQWFFNSGLRLQGVRYRCLKSVKTEEKKRYEAESLAWLQLYFHIEGVVKRPLPGKPKFRVAPDESGIRLAKRVRGEFKFNDYPVPSMSRMLEEFGIHVIEIETESRIDAFAAKVGMRRVIVLNALLPNDRIRLTAAHELAHHLYEDCTSGPALPQEEIEARAFEFASHLLIPENQLETAFKLKSMVRLVQYKERFGISLAAMIYRARKSDLISQRLYERIWRDFGRLGLNRHEPGYVAPDRPRRMEALLDSALTQNLISIKGLAQIAGKTEEQIKNRLILALGGDPVYDSGSKNDSVVNFERYRGENFN